MSPAERRRVRALVRDLQWRSFNEVMEGEGVTWGADSEHWAAARAYAQSALAVAKLLEQPDATECESP